MMDQHDWPYRVEITEPNWHAVQVWCEMSIGEFDQDWYKLGIDPLESWVSGQTKSVWYFRRQSDAVAFTLRWA